EALKALTHSESGKAVSEALTDLIAKIGENMSIRRTASVSVDEGVVAHYMHNKVADGLGKIGVIVGVQSRGNKEVLADLGKKLAMHIANTDPGYVERSQVDSTALDRERSILAEQARASGKPENIIEKMVEGRLRKFYEEVCLMEQVFVIDGERKVSEVVSAAAKESGSEISISGFARFKLGEGIEKGETPDFAAEVAAAAGQA
ncbi:MAG: translation elongation factor Ts, partial [Kiloniellales bacterium]|nr:translation elongation factor Ts [Kiloniellales bacterium]